MSKEKFDFSGYATKNDLKCSDGRTIRKDAFKHNDGQTVPLVWQHMHNDPTNILGHAVLENRNDGVYSYCVFNDTDAGLNAKSLVRHGDIKSLSIYANHLKEQSSDVVHGDIKEVSLVLAGANPGAFIDNLCIEHSDGSYETSNDEAIIYTDTNISLTDTELEHKDKTPPQPPAPVPTPTETDKTVQDILDSMNEEQKNVCYLLISEALTEGTNNTDTAKSSGTDNKDTTTVKHSNNEGEDENMKKNIFDKGTDTKDKELKHSADEAATFSDVKRYGSLKDSAIAHGITNLDYLFPDAQTIDNTPQFIKRDTNWVQVIMNGIHHTPFSRIKSIFADITEDDARAKGYITGNLKKEEVFSLLKRTTTPTTIYKKQKIDRDDLVDITDFDTASWIKTEMRTMLDEEIARALLIGDGRLSSSDDKINESNIRPIWKDDALYSIKSEFAVGSSDTDDEKAKAFIKASIKSRKEYKGSGNPLLFITEDMLTNCLLLEDTTGRVIYDSVDKLATALRVSSIVSVPVMEDQTRVDGSYTYTLHGIFINLNDYNLGADKGGAVNLFDDFDIDFNAQKYLIETRASGALIKPFSAIIVESKSTTV